MKKTILISLILFTFVFAFAEASYRIEQTNPLPGTKHSRTEVIAYQETFETGATGWSFVAQTGTNLWHIAEVTDAPSPTHAMINQNTSGSYNPSMLNYLISPSITLPLNLLPFNLSNKGCKS